MSSGCSPASLRRDPSVTFVLTNVGTVASLLPSGVTCPEPGTPLARRNS